MTPLLHELPPREEPGPPAAAATSEGTYSVTITFSRRGPGIASRENVLRVGRSIRASSLSLALLAGAAVGLSAAYARLQRPQTAYLKVVDRLLETPRPPENHPPEAAGIAPGTLAGGQEDVITPLNARDPSMLVLAPGGPYGAASPSN